MTPEDYSLWTWLVNRRRTQTARTRRREGLRKSASEVSCMARQAAPARHKFSNAHLSSTLLVPDCIPTTAVGQLRKTVMIHSLVVRVCVPSIRWVRC